jgi:serine/threonine protein phosphatase PrpC
MTTTVGSGLAVRAFAQASATGSRHERRGIGNDDAVACGPVPAGLVAAVADGHSDPRCVRARAGADFAVEAAIAAGGEATVAGFAGAAITGWRDRVDADLRRSPQPELRRLAYGTTLLACRVTADGLTLLRVGDGEIVLVDVAGAAWRPLPVVPPTSGPAGATSTMADDRAGDVARTAFVPAQRSPRLVLLASDGIDNAYLRNDALLEAARDLAERPELRDPAHLQSEVGAWVVEAAATSGDDATAAVLVLVDQVR